MILRNKDVRQLTASDLLSLVHDQVRESEQLDYKQDLPGHQDSDRKEFVKDVTAMANARGGVLLFGVTEKRNNGRKTGYPEALVGVTGPVGDDELRRLETMIRDNTDPPLASCVAVPVSLADSKSVVAFGVPRSPLAPHAVTVSSRTYWRRGNTGNYPLGTRELRQVFLEHSEWDEEVEQFREDRTDIIRRRRIVPNLDTDGSFFLHVLPLGRLNDPADIMTLRDDFALKISRMNLLPTMERRANLDGYLLYDGTKADCKTYVQWFRFGGIEYYSSHFHKREADGKPLDFEASKMASRTKPVIKLALDFLQRLGVGPPYAVLFTLFDVEGGSIPTHWLGMKAHLMEVEHNRFDRNSLYLPALVLEDLDTPLEQALMPAFDMLWQAAGFNKSFLNEIEGGW